MESSDENFLETADYDDIVSNSTSETSRQVKEKAIKVAENNALQKAHELRPKDSNQTTVIIKESISKASLRSQQTDLANKALIEKLQHREITCEKCWGTGEVGNGKTCKKCGGNGIIKKEPEIRAIELVLKPQFPKTSVNLNASVDNMTTSELIELLKSMTPVK